MYDKHFVGLDLTGLQGNGIQKPISRVTLLLDDDNAVTAGDDTGMELTADCPHATQAMADAILAQVKGLRYRMFSADDARLDPAAELGDGITAGGIYSVLARASDDGSGYGSLTTLWVDNTPNVPLDDILAGAEDLDRVRLIGGSLTAASEEALGALVAKLKGCSGLDAVGNNTERAVVTGRVSVPSVSAELLAEISDAFPQLVVVAGGQPQYVVRYLDWDNTLLYRAVVGEGEDAVDPVTAGLIDAPTRPDAAGTGYDFLDFGALPTNIHGNVSVVARYETVTRTYTVKFYNGSTLLQTVTGVPYGGSAEYTGSTPVSPDGSAEDYPFEGWDPAPTNIVGNTNCYAKFDGPEEAEITDTWEEIFEAIADGTYKTKYKVGNYKPLDMGAEGIINMQIADKDKDKLADGSGTAPISWVGKELLNTSRRINPNMDHGSNGIYKDGTGCVGGWEKSEIRTYYQETLLPMIPEIVREHIVAVEKGQNAYDGKKHDYFYQKTTDFVWMPSRYEMLSTTHYKLFPNNASRVKMKIGITTPIRYWVRDAASANYAHHIKADGSLGQENASLSLAITFGFCT